MSRPFVKMNGLGNDFVVVEAGSGAFSPSAAQVRALADRGRGVGFDQLISIERSDRANAFARFWNADGGEVGACGNGSRCAGWLVLQASGRDSIDLETAAGVLRVRRAGAERVTVDMGPPKLAWNEIPLSGPMDTAAVDLRPIADWPPPGCVSMGNPHVVFFVPDAETAPVARIGPMIERHALFPQRVNVGFAQIRTRRRIRLRVWERGAGLTRACGTGACAAVVAAHRRGLVDDAVTVRMDGGVLSISWAGACDDPVLMTGPVAIEFTGRLPALEAAA
jgi:diaminopimelate epimerase